MMKQNAMSVGVLAVVLLALSLTSVPLTSASASATIPDRCHYVYATTTHRMAAVVVGLVNKMNAYAELGRAHEAVQLSINLQCPTEPMLKSVDCAIEIVKRQQGEILRDVQVLECVEESTGVPFPTFPN